MLVTCSDLGRLPRVPAETACTLGFIAPWYRDVLAAAAQNHNQSEITATLRRASHRPAEDLEALQALVAHPKRFASRARRAHLRCNVRQPHWTWPVTSIADTLAIATADQLSWLTSAMRAIRNNQLEADMEAAWREAFWIGVTDP